MDRPPCFAESPPGSADRYAWFRPEVSGRWCSRNLAVAQRQRRFGEHIVAPAEFGAATHLRARRNGEVPRFQIAVEHARRQQLDARGALDVAFDLSADRDRVRVNAA